MITLWSQRRVRPDLARFLSVGTYWPVMSMSPF